MITSSLTLHPPPLTHHSHYYLPQLSYGLKLNSESSTSGHMTCKILSTYVGAVNASFILSDDYGRSRMDKSVYSVTWLNKIAMFNSYAR